MTIRDFLNDIDNMDPETRKSAILSLSKVLTPISLNTLLTFQENYASNPDLNWEYFYIAQNEELKKCIFIEMSEDGIEMREKLNMPLLTLETEI